MGKLARGIEERTGKKVELVKDAIKESEKVNNRFYSVCRGCIHCKKIVHPRPYRPTSSSLMYLGTVTYKCEMKKLGNKPVTELTKKRCTYKNMVEYKPE